MQTQKHGAFWTCGLELTTPALKLLWLQMCTHSAPSSPPRTHRALVTIYPRGLFAVGLWALRGSFGQSLLLVGKDRADGRREHRPPQVPSLDCLLASGSTVGIIPARTGLASPEHSR